MATKPITVESSSSGATVIGHVGKLAWVAKAIAWRGAFCIAPCRFFQDEMTISSEQKDFIEKEILSRTLQGAFQRVQIYDKSATNEDREQFREIARNLLRKSSVPYRIRKISSQEHINNIDTLKSELKIVKFGVAQKLLNLYLKWLWCAGYLYDAPPHCPIDSIILAKIKTQEPRWPLLSKELYEERVRKISEIAQQEGLEIASWELRFFNHWNPAYGAGDKPGRKKSEKVLKQK